MPWVYPREYLLSLIIVIYTTGLFFQYSPFVFIPLGDYYD